MIARDSVGNAINPGSFVGEAFDYFHEFVAGVACRISAAMLGFVVTYDICMLDYCFHVGRRGVGARSPSFDIFRNGVEFWTDEQVERLAAMLTAYVERQERAAEEA